MSSYRDDMNDTAVAHDATWMGLRSIAEGAARASNAILSAVLVLHMGNAVAGDGVVDRVRPLTVEQAQAQDVILDGVRAKSVFLDAAHAGDATIDRVRLLLTDAAQASDGFSAGFREVLIGRSAISDEVIHHKRVKDTPADKARASGGPVSVSRLLLADGAQAGDSMHGRVRGRHMAEDGAGVTDAIMDARQSVASPLMDRALASATAFDKLFAFDLVADGVQAEAGPIQFGDFGQAWTTNTGSWPMSRYAPFTFTSLAVIDGVVYATGAGGVFALDSQDEDIAALMRTGKLDMGKDTLVRLVEAPVEYELDGTAALDVTETQNGVAPETYTYEPDARDALVLTNSRFQLGRGLKGRHFTFALSLQGRRGYINDLRVTVAPSKRSM